MKFTRAELKLFRNNLVALSAYKDAEIPHGETLWYPWMKSTLERLEETLRRTEHVADDHQILT